MPKRLLTFPADTYPSLGAEYRSFFDDFEIVGLASTDQLFTALRGDERDTVLVNWPAPGLEISKLQRELAHRDRLATVIVVDQADELASDTLLADNPRVHVLTGEAERAQWDLISREREAPAGQSNTTSDAASRLLVGDSPAIQEVYEMVKLVACRRSTVLITGETGTGKELVARAIHLASSRGHLPMVAVNCAALPENLIEAELFGHARGAFTGAIGHRVGRFEQAHRSSILLDEVGELPLEVQAKLLRVLQERELQRIGSSDTLRVDCRVIAATNIALETAVRESRFRQDLFYRLNVVPLRVPALRERLSDIPLLVEHFIERICRHEGMPHVRVTTDALERMCEYSWPGNVRQLEHAVEMAVVLSRGKGTLEARDFRLPEEQKRSLSNPAPDVELPAAGVDLEKLIDGIQKALVEQALRRSNGNKARAADLLGLKRTTLLSKVKAMRYCA